MGELSEEDIKDLREIARLRPYYPNMAAAALAYYRSKKLRTLQ